MEQEELNQILKDLEEKEKVYKNWLYRDIIKDNLPWKERSKLTFESFLEKYSLHDSFWIGLFYSVGSGKHATLAFEWDAVWLPEDIKEDNELEDWPFLFIKINNVDEISTSNYGDLGDLNRAIGGIEYEHIEGKNYLSVSDVYAGRVEIIYSGDAFFLALDVNRNIIAI